MATTGHAAHRIIEKHAGARDALIPILQDIQAEEGYLSQEALEAVSEGMSIPLIQVYGVATFFRAFSLEPRGRRVVCACTGTACHVRGASAVLDELERQLGVCAGQTTGDGEYSLETVNCLGACALGPVVVVDGINHGHMTRADVQHLLGGEPESAGADR